MIRRYSFRLYPTPAQAADLARTFGACRWVYNQALAERTVAWQRGERIAYPATDKGLNAKKKKPETAWLQEVSSVPLQQALRHLERAFSNFYAKRTAYPVFHKRGRNDAATYTANGFRYDASTRRLFLAKLGPVKVRWSRDLPTAPSSVTVKRAASGRYTVSFVVEVPAIVVPRTGESVGIDLGISRLATLSTGERIPNPKHGVRLRKRLALAQKTVSRRYEARKVRRAAVKKAGGDPKLVRPSNRERKARQAVARVHERIADARNDTLQKLTTTLVRRFDTIYVENLNVRGMVKNHALARALSDASLGSVVRLLESKAAASGKAVVKVDRFFPSSKLCSGCGYRLDKLPLSSREWDCPACGAHHDRDYNAALNILAVGQTVAAHGDGVKPSRATARQRSCLRSANHPNASS